MATYQAFGTDSGRTWANSFDLNAGAIGGAGTLVYDVNEMVFQLTPEDTPFYMMIGDGDAEAEIHWWLEQSLTTRSHNAYEQGSTFSATTSPIRPTSRANNVQTIEKNLTVSRINQRVRHYGVEDMFGENLVNRLVEWKTDAEHTLIRGSLASGISGTAAQMNGMFWLITTVTTTVTSNSGLSFHEDVFNDMFQLVWEQGGNPMDVLVGANGRRRISSFTAGSTKYLVQNDRARVHTFSVYESDFGTVEIHLSRDILDTKGDAATSALLLITRQWLRKMWIDRPFALRLPQTRDAIDGEILGDLTLEAGALAAHGALHSVNYTTATTV